MSNTTDSLAAASRLALALTRAGYSPEEIERLAATPNMLAHVLELMRGAASYGMTDFSASREIPEHFFEPESPATHLRLISSR